MLTRFQQHLQQRHTSLWQEFLAGLTTFFTMAYIVILAPSMYAETGMNFSSSFFATCLICSVTTFMVGVWANLPVGVAPGLGLLSYFTFVAVGQLHYSYQLALGAVFLSGYLFLCITLTRIRRHWCLSGSLATLKSYCFLPDLY